MRRGMMCGPWDMMGPFGGAMMFDRRDIGDKDWCEGVAVFFLSTMIQPENGEFIPDDVVKSRVELARRYAKEMLAQNKAEQERAEKERERKRRIEQIEHELKRIKCYKPEDDDYKELTKAVSDAEAQIADVKASMEGDLSDVVKETMQAKLKGLQKKAREKKNRLNGIETTLKQREARMAELREELEGLKADESEVKKEAPAAV